MSLPSTSAFPWALIEEMVANGDTPQTEVALLAEEAIRYLVGAERELPTVMIGEQGNFETLAAANFKQFHFKSKPFVSSILVELLIDGLAQNTSIDMEVELTVGATFQERALTLNSFAAAQLDEMGFVSVLFENVAGSDSGKAAAGNQTCTLRIFNDDTVSLVFWAVNVTQLHTDILEE